MQNDRCWRHKQFPPYDLPPFPVVRQAEILIVRKRLYAMHRNLLIHLTSPPKRRLETGDW